MIEVFKTDVLSPDHATMLTTEIHSIFKDYQVNFDLHDCDNILRVKCMTGLVQPEPVINFLKDFGFNAEVLPDA